METVPVVEKDIKQCKRCKVNKQRILVGKFDTFNKKYQDESGKLWNGHTCGECNVIRVRESIRKLRVKRNAPVLPS